MCEKALQIYQKKFKIQNQFRGISPDFYIVAIQLVEEERTEELTQFGEELMQNPHQVTQRQTIISHHTLDLMELCQMSGVQRLIAKHTVYREVLHWCELLLNNKETHIISEWEM